MRVLIIIGVLIFGAISNGLAAKNRFETGGPSVLFRSYKSLLVAKFPDLQKYEDCVDKSGGVTVNLMDCSGNEIDTEDKKLNEYYKQLLDGLSEREKAQLKGAQRSWIRDRDRTCDKVSDADGGGTMSAVMYSECILLLTVKRKNEIMAFIKK